MLIIIKNTVDCLWCHLGGYDLHVG